MRNLFFAVVFFITAFSFSQNVKFEGTIKDSTGVVLEMANIMAVNQATKAMDGYSITDDKGRFQILLNPNTSYSVKVSYVGFQPYETTIKTTTENIVKHIVLKEGTMLNEIEIVKEMPVSISGDTIIYNSDSFRNGTERKLEDVLKKLPGVEVNKDGEIQVEGKKVQKVMVEGKDFFDGDTKIATKNIPADALDKIQVLRNYNEVSNLKGFENNEENVALNIKLKEGKKNFWFGDITAGIGVGHKEDRHIVNPKLFYYNPKYSLNVIGNLNNIGELPLTMQDYFKFTGGFKNMMRKAGTSFNVSSNDLGILGLRNNQAKEIDTKFGAANFSYNPSKAWTISGFGILMGSQTDLQTTSKSTRVDSRKDTNGNTLTTTTVNNESSTTNQNSNLGLFKLSSSYVPSEKVHFDYDALLKISKQDEKTTLLSNSTQTNDAGVYTLFNDVYSNKKQNPFSVNQNLNYYYTLNEKNVFAFELQHLYQDEDPFYNANLKIQPFDLGLEYQTGQTRNDVNQSRFVKTNKLDGKFDYYYMLTPKSNINITLGNTYSCQNFNSHIFQVLNGGTRNDLDDAKNNNKVNYAFNDVFLGLHYKFLMGKFTFNPGFSVHNYQTTDQQLGSSNKNSFNRILPDVYALWQLKKSETLTYNFMMSNNFTDINKLAEGYVFSNYNSLFGGNRFLENSLSQVHSLRYFRYNMFNFENIFANLMYTKQVDGVKSKAMFTGINQQSTAVNMNSSFADETLSGSGNYGRSFLRYYKASLGASLNWSKFNNIRVYPDLDLDPNNNPTEVQSTESFTQNYNVKFSTNYKKIPNIELAYNFTVNDFTSDTFYVDSPSVTLEYYFWDAFSFTSEYSFYHNRNKSKTSNNEYDFLTANLMYQKKDSKWEWKLSGTNLLNTTSLNDSGFNQIGGGSIFSSYFVQPRYVILSLKYAL
ncbi:carboxypeptidase-like regulatory domain-containing protein [Flavobacterium sp. SM15]|uniref:carboxypeptidase-like regulatory domain-containing protein n=1 Tax=Flavobacterium sp. SM15 TaxID=2908005 RepID=UPI001EDAF241|nr:carboxypeptidase-like regulatory domain-containing protein [Flavobacterium sp. SM15]MCG2609929.1 carboxypeptidase-like regulatory domain-containing protein [Flavobacterium sp. SM15]